MITLSSLRALLLAEATAFITASLIHGGYLVAGYQHRAARIAESVIGIVLVAGAALAWVRPRLTRGAALLAQGFALLGTLVGVFTIIMGVGPRTVPDIVYHIAIVILLAWGLFTAAGQRGRT
jgi:hypothetical protein